MKMARRWPAGAVLAVLLMQPVHAGHELHQAERRHAEWRESRFAEELVSKARWADALCLFERADTSKFGDDKEQLAIFYYRWGVAEEALGKLLPAAKRYRRSLEYVDWSLSAASLRALELHIVNFQQPINPLSNSTRAGRCFNYHYGRHRLDLRDFGACRFFSGLESYRREFPDVLFLKFVALANQAPTEKGAAAVSLYEAAKDCGLEILHRKNSATAITSGQASVVRKQVSDIIRLLFVHYFRQANSKALLKLCRDLERVAEDADQFIIRTLAPGSFANSRDRLVCVQNIYAELEPRLSGRPKLQAALAQLLALHLWASGNVRAAVPLLQRAVRLNPTPERFLYSAGALYEDKQYKLSAEYMHSAIKTGGALTHQHYSMYADTLSRLSRTQEAIAALDKAYAMAPPEDVKFRNGVSRKKYFCLLSSGSQFCTLSETNEIGGQRLILRALLRSADPADIARALPNVFAPCVAARIKRIEQELETCSLNQRAKLRLDLSELYLILGDQDRSLAALTAVPVTRELEMRWYSMRVAIDRMSRHPSPAAEQCWLNEMMKTSAGKKAANVCWYL